MATQGRFFLHSSAKRMFLAARESMRTVGDHRRRFQVSRRERQTSLDRDHCRSMQNKELPGETVSTRGGLREEKARRSSNSKQRIFSVNVFGEHEKLREEQTQ